MAQRRRGKKPLATGGRGTLDRLTSEIIELKGHTGKNLYDLGTRLARVREEELWRAGDFESFEEYLERAVDVSRSTAYKLVRIAREFNRMIAERYGVEKLDLGLRYLDHTPADERPGDLLAADIRIRDERGRWHAVPFHQANVPQIRAAIALLQDHRDQRRRVPAELERRARRLAEALPPTPAGLTTGSRVRLRRAADGRVAATFSAIPIDELEVFIAALKKHLL
jgi:hypothetical protein